MKFYQVTTSFACGGVLTDQAGVIAETCPIYRKWIGQPLSALLKHYRGAIAILIGDTQPKRPPPAGEELTTGTAPGVSAEGVG